MRVLFAARGTPRTAWYRIVLPAMHLGQDWAGFVGDPPNVMVLSSCVQGQSVRPNLADYDVIVFQQAEGAAWFRTIRKLRDQGTTVLYEVDDDLHAVHRQTDHDWQNIYDKQRLKDLTLCMKACDGMIVSTDALAERYEQYARYGRIWVCENGLDMKRYELTRPPRGKVGGKSTVTVMWSGGTGHLLAASPWLTGIADAMRKYPYVCFASIGQGFAKTFEEHFPGRTIVVPFCALESYPSAMMIGDIALAPAGRTDWYKAKSQLRAMEAAALGIPVIADGFYAPTVHEGETGYLIEAPVQVLSRIERLLDVAERDRMGSAAKALAYEEFAMEHRAGQWTAALEQAREAVAVA